MIRHSNPTIKNKVLRQLLANELYMTHKKARPAPGDIFFNGYRFGLYTAYERIQQNLGNVKGDR